MSREKTREKRQRKNFRLEPDTVAKIEAHADREGCTNTDVIQRAVDLYDEIFWDGSSEGVAARKISVLSKQLARLAGDLCARL